MPLIQWNDGLAVGIARIDAQHRRLVEMTNDLHEAMLRGMGRKVVGEIIQMLVDYTVTHFSTEERYFDQYGYPNSAGHRREHADFIGRAVDFRERYDRGEPALSVEVVDFLSDWLKSHIMGPDRTLGAFLSSKGLS